MWKNCEKSIGKNSRPAKSMVKADAKALLSGLYGYKIAQFSIKSDVY